MCCCDCILVLIALVFPPFPVWVKCGLCSAEMLINIALCFLGYLPGVIHSFYIIAKYPIRYVVLDVESQSYHVVRDSEAGYTATPPPTTTGRPIQQQQIQDSQRSLIENSANYGSTSSLPTEQPPAYTAMSSSTSKN